ncbi:MAG: hypothetical protein U9N38_03660, partial [Thermodesulfobacteriota bacterium]|nr:hypothetical protein [Thermodesulfobacteriota bacterium]
KGSIVKDRLHEPERQTWEAKRLNARMLHLTFVRVLDVLIIYCLLKGLSACTAQAGKVKEGKSQP